MAKFGSHEQAVAAGKASGESRRRKAALTAAQQAQIRLEKNADLLVDLAVEAAMGRGSFEDLPVKERAAMLKFALEQILGRPGGRAAPVDETKDEPEPEGLKFQTRPGEEVGRGQSNTWPSPASGTVAPFPGSRIDVIS